MVGREEEASSIASAFACLLQIWREWDVRGMVLLSLLLQIALYVLGKRRKYSVCPTVRMILWLAYISADWVVIIALGKLSSAPALSPTKNVLRAIWAPILILHLGGPDTITAYTLEDTQLWTRHIFTLVVQSIFAIYVIIYLSWSYLRLSILTIPLMVAGIIKYVERILCLELTNSKKTEPVISTFHDAGGLETAVFLNHLLNEHPDSIIVVLGYLLFSVMRPDANYYLSGKLYLRSSQVRIKTYLKGTKFHQKLILEGLLKTGQLSENPFDIAAAEMGFIFDIVYTKASLIYTKKGCVLRVISFTCSFSVLLFFLISIKDEPKFHFSSVDIYITISLLVGAVALEFFAVYSMFSSHWTIPLILFHESRWVRKILWYVFKCFPRLLVPRRNMRLGRMGQFNLLDYYWKSNNSKVYGFLKKCFSSRILENLYKYNCAGFVEVPNCLKLTKDYQDCLDFFFKDNSFEPTWGEKILGKIKGKATFDDSQYKRLKETIELDFDTSIIVWHLATSICYYQDVHSTCRIEDKKRSKYISDYMMYLVALQPAMLLPERCKSFWLDSCDELKDLFSKGSNMDHALTLLLNQGVPDASIPDPLNEVLQHVSNLVTTLNRVQIWGKWTIIKEMWIEMLLYGAHSCQHVNHVKQLAQSDHEFLTLIWIMGGSWFIEKAEF